MSSQTTPLEAALARAAEAEANMKLAAQYGQELLEKLTKCEKVRKFFKLPVDTIRIGSTRIFTLRITITNLFIRRIGRVDRTIGKRPVGFDFGKTGRFRR